MGDSLMWPATRWMPGRNRIDHAGASPLHGSTCAVCASSRLAPLFRKDGYLVYHCRECGVRFLSPQPDDAALSAIYTDEYRLGERTPNSEARVDRLKRATAKLYLDLLIPHLATMPGRLFEIGCGTGQFLVEARARGFEVSGIEISPSAAAIANRHLGGQLVSVGTLESATPTEASFDVVAFADVVEHVRDPLAFLQKVHSILKPHGTVFLVTPSLDTWSARLLGKYWMEYKAEHLFYFSRRTIRPALERSGFCQIAFMPNAKVLDFDYIHHHFRRFPVPLMTPLLSLARRLMPESLAHRQVQLVASGVVAMATKAHDRPLA